MPPLSTEQGYGTVTKFLHWLTVVLLLAQFVLGYGMEGFAEALFEEDSSGHGHGGDRARAGDDQLVFAHAWLGGAILAVAVIRLMWRSATPLPPWSERLTEVDRRLENWAEWILYATLFVIPLSGVALLSPTRRTKEFAGLAVRELLHATYRSDPPPLFPRDGPGHRRQQPAGTGPGCVRRSTSGVRLAPMMTTPETGRMRGSRAWELATIAGAIVLIAYVVELLAGSDLSKTVASTGRVAVVIAAVVCAGVIYQSWSVRKRHTARDHSAMVAALLGGALAASSAFSAPAGQIFGNSLTAAAGVAGLALALVGSRPAIGTEGHR